MKTLEEQLKNKANYLDKGKLFLVSCMNCSEKGKENYAPAVAAGICAWCGWGYQEKKDE